jgi:hypothetical protein
MSDRLLASIIELEKTLQEEVRQEAARAAAWQDRELAALDDEALGARRQAERWGEEQAEAARQLAEADGEKLQAVVAARCARLGALTESFLERVLQPRLKLLLPEVGNDHPDGEGRTGRAEG